MKNGYKKPRTYASHREAVLVLKFGITEAQYAGMLEKQDNKCAICRLDRSQFNKNFCVDHCHATGKIRGLLCTACNVGLSRFRDRVDLLQNAIEYLSE